MKKKSFLFLSLLTFVCHAQPGKEAWHWYFGQAGLDFSSGAPLQQPSQVGWLTAAIATISDETTGQFLFFTNGVNVGTSTGSTMSNGVGLLGDLSATQTLIVPHPGNKNLFYIISVDKLGGLKGAHYSLVDISQNNGLGKVTIKNKTLALPRMTEKVTAVRHCNGKDYWVLLHGYNSNAFMAYLVSTQGLDTIPVLSNTGTSHHFIPPYDDEATGYMKASPDGSKIAVGISSDSLPLLEILDVNNATGQISNPISITFPGMQGPYGLSFSPDNSKLYACVYPGDTISRIYQYDLSSGIPSTIISSQTLIGDRKWDHTNGHGAVEAMQMGSDGKIYAALYYLDTLAVIESPNLLGLACNLQWGGLVTGPPWWAFCMFGLPNFIDANYAGIQLHLQDIKQCDSFKPDTLNAGIGFTNYQWSTGVSTQSIVVNNPGTYWVTVTNVQGCTRTDTVHAYLLNGGMKKNVSACMIDTVNTTQSIVLAYNWSDGTTSPVKIFNSSGTYYEDVSFMGGCSVRDTFIVSINPNPAINLGRDTAFCKGDLKLDAYYPGATYKWNAGETSSSIEATKPGKYFVKVTNQYGCVGSDTLVVYPEPLVFNFSMPNIVTPNGDNLNDEIDFSRLQFSELQIHIYNRWGQKIFESDDANAIWKPTTDDGTYFYTANYRIDCGIESQTKNIKGFITVIR